MKSITNEYLPQIKAVTHAFPESLGVLSIQWSEGEAQAVIVRGTDEVVATISVYERELHEEDPGSRGVVLCVTAEHLTDEVRDRVTDYFVQPLRFNALFTAQALIAA
jgi:hypothetical protein